jgi:hypothetical protein
MRWRSPSPHAQVRRFPQMTPASVINARSGPPRDEHADSGPDRSRCWARSVAVPVCARRLESAAAARALATSAPDVVATQAMEPAAPDAVAVWSGRVASAGPLASTAIAFNTQAIRHPRNSS